MVAMAAVVPSQNSPVQDRTVVDMSISRDSLDASPFAAPGSAASTAPAAADGPAHFKVTDVDDDIDETAVRIEMADMSLAVSKDDLNDEDEELEEELDAAKVSRNPWAAKKTVAQGMMDIALLTSNANQLRYLIMYGGHSSTYVISISLIAISILLQVAVGVALIFKGKSDLKGEEKRAHADRLNMYVVVGVFLVTIINVFAASFSDVSRDTKN